MAMNSTEIRKIDELGRVVLPKAVRNKLGLNPIDSVKITVEDGRIIIEPYSSVCLFCGNNENLVEYMGKTTCKECIAKLNHL